MFFDMQRSKEVGEVLGTETETAKFFLRVWSNFLEKNITIRQFLVGEIVVKIKDWVGGRVISSTCRARRSAEKQNLEF